MKAFLLAAGYGTRLRPLTNTVPKCMVPIQGKPLLAWWMQLFARHHVTDVLLNTHYLPETIRDYINNYNEKNTGTQLHEFYEPVLLGSGGTVQANQEFVAGEDDFLICYADNLTNTNLSDMIAFHKQKQGLLTMGLFHTNNPRGCGIAAVNDHDLIYEFIEKPEQPKSNLANAGIYVVNHKIFDYIPQSKELLDFGKDVLPLLVNKMYGYEIRDYILDIGTWPNYEKAQKEWRA
jgi:mannose-1-phosphate guanylyltransferase